MRHSCWGIAFMFRTCTHLRFRVTGNALLRRLVRIGVLDENRMKLDYVLGLKIEDFLERRLETQVRYSRTVSRFGLSGGSITLLCVLRYSNWDWQNLFTTLVS